MSEYDIAMRRGKPSFFSLDTALLKPGMRLAVGLSGGADSVALLRSLAEQNVELGLVLSVAHLHHGLRGAEADGDMEFARQLALELGLPFHSERVDVRTAAQANREKAKPSESVEEAARRLRYGWFRQLMASGEVDAVATAHTQDDQAETVCGKFLRGAWTEGLSGIHPVVQFPEGKILRPLLQAARAQVEEYLRALGQNWREDSSNLDLVYTRNRIRRELLPLLENWNPQLREHLAQMAELARDEESWWQAQLAWLAPQLILPGTPVRGGGRSGGDGVAIDVTKLAEQPPALQRRLLRHAAGQLGAALDFVATEDLRRLALSGRAGQKRELAGSLHAERTHRELRLRLQLSGVATEEDALEEFAAPIPGEIEGFGFRLRIASLFSDRARGTAILRNWRAGDRVQLRYSSGPKRVKEVLERLQVSGSDRTQWPVLEVGGRIVWMQGVDVEPVSGISVTVAS